MVFSAGEENDETVHAKYHDMYLMNLRFLGWKNEHVVGEYTDGRIIMVTKESKNFMLKKVKEILVIANRDLGFPSDSFPIRPNATFLLFISNDKRVAGCVVGESITSACHVILDTRCSVTCETKEIELKNVWKIGNWCCSSEAVPAICGVNRIWVAKEHRRRKIASRLMDCLRCHFLYGYVVGIRELAFTDPSPDGREFAAAYTGTDNFLVYK
ncbi:N-acetyltransferase ESCO1, partial [Stegodyphus mimosarum]